MRGSHAGVKRFDMEMREPLNALAARSALR
jgi:hypothetical protein